MLCRACCAAFELTAQRRLIWAAVAPIFGLAVMVQTAALANDTELAGGRRGRLAIVIDDVGREMVQLKRLLRLPASLTYAILPHAPHTKASLARIRRTGREYILHLPMQPESGSQITDEPIVLRTGKPVAPVLDECLRRVPGAKALNNHMGSLYTSRPDAVRALVDMVRRRGLWLLDSRTSPNSRMCTVASRLGVTCVSRDLFLDDPNDTATIRDRLLVAAKRARQRGWAVAIGHPHPSTVNVLESVLASGKLGVHLVSLSAIAVAARRRARMLTRNGRARDVAIRTATSEN